MARFSDAELSFQPGNLPDSEFPFAFFLGSAPSMLRSFSRPALAWSGFLSPTLLTPFAPRRQSALPVSAASWANAFCPDLLQAIQHWHKPVNPCTNRLGSRWPTGPSRQSPSQGRAPGRTALQPAALRGRWSHLFPGPTTRLHNLLNRTAGRTGDASMLDHSDLETVAKARAEQKGNF